MVGAHYTLRVWLLEASTSQFFLGSTQWSPKEFAITNEAGVIEVAENMDVYDYDRFDWVLRLYDEIGNQVAFTERFVDATTNRAPLLAAIGSFTTAVGQPVERRLFDSDPECDHLRFELLSSPVGATLDSQSGVFRWVPTNAGEYRVLFAVTDSGDGSLSDGELVTISVAQAPLITAQPSNFAVAPGASVTFRVTASGIPPLMFQWQRNGTNLADATASSLTIEDISISDAGEYRVKVSDSTDTIISQQAVLTVYTNRACAASVDANLEHLRQQMDRYHYRIPVYDDISSPGNRFHARGQLPNQFSPVTVNGSWTNNPHSGATCNRFSFQPAPGELEGGFYFMNGILVDRSPLPYFGGTTVDGTSIPVTNFTGLNLSGTVALNFWARGEQGGEKIEFFIGGVGRDPNTGEPEFGKPFPDSTPRFPPRYTITTLGNTWQKYSIPLTNLNLTNIMGGFAWYATVANNPAGAVFFVDDIEFELSADARNYRLNHSPRFIQSFLTRPVQPDIADGNPDDDLDFVLRNLAFVYDNALAVLAFLADGSSNSIQRACLIGDAMVYAARNDRSYSDGRLRTAYSAGDIALPAGWTPNGKTNTVTVPGFYVEATQTFFEVENADVDTGNNAWGMIALLALYRYTGVQQYLDAAKAIAEFIIHQRSDAPPFSAFRGGIRNAETICAEPRTYASTEHNLDCFAAFTALYRITGEERWRNQADIANNFVELMWDDTRGCYLTGTTGGIPDTRNTTADQLPLDAQSWNVLARPDALALHPQLLECAESNHLTSVDGFDGFDFNNDHDGVWFEGTAQMVVAYDTARRAGSAEKFREQLRIAQQMPELAGNGLGLVAAARDGVTSGFGFKLFRRAHIGATAWNVFAQLGFNPYYASPLKIEDPLRTADGIQFRFRALSCRQYFIEYTESLSTPVWQTLVRFPLSALSTNHLVSVGVNERSGFYRVSEMR